MCTLLKFGSLKHLSTNLTASWLSIRVAKGALHADTMPRLSASESFSYSSNIDFGSTPTRTRSKDEARDVGRGKVIGRLRMPAVHCAVLHTKTVPDGSDERSSADN
jgi:hypothetical protein